MSHQSAVFVGRGADVIIKCEIFKADTQAFQKCRQLTVLLWMTVLLAKHVFWYPTQQTNFHLSMYWLFLTAIQSTVMISGQPYTLGRFDTAGQEDDDDLRYPQTNVVLTSMVAQMVKNLPAMWKTQVRSLGSGRSPAEGNGYPLQYSCLENPMGRGAWLASVHGVTKCRTRLSD